MADAAIAAVLSKFGELAANEARLLIQVDNDMMLLQDRLEWLQAFIRDADRKRRAGTDGLTRVWVRQTRDVAFQAEDAVDEFLYERDEGGDNSPTHINQKPNAFLGRKIANEKHIQSSKLSAYANAHAIEVATAVFLDSIFKRDHRIDHARPAIDAATAPDDSTILRKSITLHPSRDTIAPCRGDSTTPTQQKHTAPPQHHCHPLSAPKNDAPNRENDVAPRHRPIRETRV
ncbi:hypothetical protein QYE76_059334 [Lolium multiflorum]|uniref:Disease resistance N-terminal domain-containing protein n=1 Tax=Lolium multiflorum TaxID=4521 RepID=A0AAD8RXV5_LOLMU|nr:hypothetical protein QYE76_059334 [Lolium multiflorum]